MEGEISNKYHNASIWIVCSLSKLVDQDPKVCFLMETRLDKEGYDKHCRELPFQNKLIMKRPNSSGGLALVWKRDVNLDVINFKITY